MYYSSKLMGVSLTMSASLHMRTNAEVLVYAVSSWIVREHDQDDWIRLRMRRHNYNIYFGLYSSTT